MATALLVHGLEQLGDDLVAVERFGYHWLLARHRGRAALVSTHGNARSCQMAQRLAAVHGHARLDWAMILDPVATDVLPCWQELAQRVEASQQGRAPIAIGQVLRSTAVEGWTSALAAVSQPSGLVDTAGAAAIRTPAGDHRNMAWL